MHRSFAILTIAVSALALSACASGSSPGEPSPTPDTTEAMRQTFTLYLKSINAWDRDNAKTLDRTLGLVTEAWGELETGSFYAPEGFEPKTWSISSAERVKGHEDEPALGVCLNTGAATGPMLAFFEPSKDAPHGWLLSGLLPGGDAFTCPGQTPGS